MVWVYNQNTDTWNQRGRSSITGTAGMSAPTAAATWGNSGYVYTFDGSGSIQKQGSITAYAWTFGDGGTATGVKPSHTFTGPGTFSVTLTVTGTSGLSVSQTYALTVSYVAPPVPTARFTFTQGTGTDLYRADFDASTSSVSSGAITAYDWAFGNGATFHSTSPSARGFYYTGPGTFTVKLTVTTDTGATSSVTHPITVMAAPVNHSPVAVIKPPVVSGLSVKFDGASSSDPDAGDAVTSYLWDFGDGTSSSAATPTHVYASGGAVTVKLTVTDKSGAQGVATTTANPVSPSSPGRGPAGSYKPSPTTSGLLTPVSSLTKIDRTYVGPLGVVSTNYNSGANWPAFIPNAGVNLDSVWFHLPMWVPAGRNGTARNCYWDGFGIPNLIDKRASNYQAPLKSGATDWACLDFSPVAVSGAAGNNTANWQIYDSLISGPGKNDSVNGIRGCGFTLKRSTISSVVDGIDLFRNGTSEELGVYLEANYIGLFTFLKTPGNHSDGTTHNDGIQWAGGKNWEGFANTVEGIGDANSQTAGAPYYPAVGNTMSVTSNAGPASGMNFHDNWVDGGYHDFIAIVTSNTATRTNLGSYTNNKIGRRTKATPIQISSYMSLSASGNVYEDNGAAVGVTRGES